MSCKTKGGKSLPNNSCMLNTKKDGMGYPIGCMDNNGKGGYTNVSGIGDNCCIDNPPAKCITKNDSGKRVVTKPIPAKVSPKGSLAPALVSDTKTMTGCLANPNYPVPIGDCEAYQGCDTKYRSNTTKLCCKINPKDPNNFKCFTKSASTPTPNSAKVSQKNEKPTYQSAIDEYNRFSQLYNISSSSFGSMNNTILIIAALICLVIIILLYLKIK